MVRSVHCTATFIFVRYFNRTQKSTVTHNYVLVSSSAINLGEQLTDGNLKWQVWPTSLNHNNYFVKGKCDPSEYIGHVSLDTYYADEPITRASIVKTKNVFTHKIKRGMRAFTVPLDQNYAISKYLTAGDYVDVHVASQRKGLKASTILKNVHVLDVNDIFHNALGKNKTNSANNATKYVTLEVYPDQVDKILSSGSRYHLILSLNSSKKNIVKAKVTNRSSKTHTVTVLRRMNKEEITIA